MKQANLVGIDALHSYFADLQGKQYPVVQFSTLSFSQWNSLFHAWYVGGVKVVPAAIASMLTPIAMAFWHMDDGGWVGKGIHLNTNAFTIGDVGRLIDVLRSVYGLDCSIHSRRRLFIKAKSVPAFIAIVRPYIHPHFMYKIDRSLPNPRSK